MAESREDQQAQLNVFGEYCKKWKLKVNAEKTKIFIFSRGRPLVDIHFSLKHVLIDCVDVADVRQTFYNANSLSNLFTNAIGYRIIQCVLGFPVNDCVPMNTYMTRDPCENYMFTNSNKAFINVKQTIL
jgi:hypothetical protein